MYRSSKVTVNALDVLARDCLTVEMADPLALALVVLDQGTDDSHGGAAVSPLRDPRKNGVSPCYLR